ncbi:MAG: D-alanyl-D-alanine carboxypeptidase [SAR324 cluster bacterium]|nr:D-alanyl-D-alanine carboxypeptidase [SAR324 cluster bacterium]
MSDLTRLMFLRAAAGLLLAALTLPVGSPRAASQEDKALREALRGLIQEGGAAVGGITRGPFLHAAGIYVPASIIKLATAMAAFHELGPDYRFKTEFYRDGKSNLYVRGYGDPFLVSEEWALIARELADAGVFAEAVADLIMDESAFAPGLSIDGATDSLNPYDARQGALVSNFNTIHVEVLPGGKVRTAEAQTPLTPLAARMAHGLPPGKHRINFSQNDPHGLRYSGELAAAFFRKAGATLQGRITAGTVPPGLAPVWVHRSSRNLQEGVRGMMKFSNNYIANQIVLAMGLEKHGAPARMEAGVALMRNFLRDRIGLNDGEYHLEEGSGISRLNRISLGGMLKIVESFRPWMHLLRKYGKPPLQSLAKTGTLTGVYTLAGFLPGAVDQRRPFVIMLNQSRNTRGAVYRRLARRFARTVPATR